MPGYKKWASRRQMEQAGWAFSGELATCRECGREIEWASSPKGKNVPVDPNSSTVHFETCRKPAPPRTNGRNAEPWPGDDGNRRPTPAAAPANVNLPALQGLVNAMQALTLCISENNIAARGLAQELRALLQELRERRPAAARTQ